MLFGSIIFVLTRLDIFRALRPFSRTKVKQMSTLSQPTNFPVAPVVKLFTSSGYQCRELSQDMDPVDIPVLIHQAYQ
ncbi:uncharacterized protein LOC123322472 isoform X2 [Coccinella septempunctata]|nr:uncharacterized protein LOC123321561 isoform X2 [Coccinella septempunctata]XP_044765521.1 uncharacterized protein LOC123321816 isoform X2 [Coccinella septempunctata]XP_044766388.1 uncharacterized protein LOC123322472 isoform X2 [Coccinella septempunctata]